VSKQVQDNIMASLQGHVDQSVIDMITVLFEKIPNFSSHSIGALIGFLFLLWSASNVFRQLKNFLEKAWDVKPIESNTIRDFIWDAIVSFFVVIGLGGLLVLSVVIEGVFYTASILFHGVFPLSPSVAQYAGFTASFIMLVIFFMLVYRVLPDIKLDLKPVFAGSLVTVILIMIGGYGMSLYLIYINPSSIYGAIGSILGLFLLLYYSSIMITIGAEFTKVYSESFKKPGFYRAYPLEPY
jgi:membrane protein